MKNRRCNSESCQLSADKKSGIYRIDMPVANIITPKIWERMARGNSRVASSKDDRKLAVDWKKFTVEDYSLCHCSIVSSVLTEDNGYHIVSPSDELVNNNGNAWSNKVLEATFRSFVNGDVFVEHVQVPELSKGKILDAIMRPVKYKGKNGKIANVQYVDILVATNRKHNDLVRRIESGELTTMSMGALAHKVQCSKCGKIIGDSDKPCTHIANQLLEYFTDSKGNRRIIAELCGSCITKDGKLVGDPESMKFIEASWVENPAFKGAVLNHFVSEVDKKAANNILNMSSRDLSNLWDDLKVMKVADCSGMIAIKITRDEIKRRRNEDLINKVVAWELGQ